jgi:hypothetical protein
MELAGIYSYNEWKNSDTLRKVQKEFEKREKVLLGSAKKDFASFCNAYERYMPAVALVWRTEFPLLDDLKKLLGKKLAENELNALLDDLNIPIKDNFYKVEQSDLVKAKDLSWHVKKYTWLLSRYGEVRPYSVAQARKALRKIDKQNFFKERREAKDRARRAIEMAKQNLPKNACAVIELMQYIIYYRTHRTDIVNRAQFQAYPMLKAFAQKIGLSYRQLLHCTKEELFGSLPLKDEIQERMAGHVMLIENGKVSCLVGKEKERLEKFFSEDVGSHTILTGKPAYLGKKIGRVKLVYSTKDFLYCCIAAALKSKLKAAERTHCCTSDKLKSLSLISAFKTFPCWSINQTIVIFVP